MKNGINIFEDLYDQKINYIVWKNTNLIENSLKVKKI